MKKIYYLIKRMVLSFALLYSFNLIVSPINLNIAVNPVSIGTVSIMGVPGMISLIILKMLIK